MIDTIYRCEICREESQNPIRWLVVNCKSAQLTVLQVGQEYADAPGARHYCGEAHAQVYISRWLQLPAPEISSQSRLSNDLVQTLCRTRRFTHHKFRAHHDLGSRLLIPL